MKAIVTGGAGFIGSHLVDALVAKGHDVTSIDLRVSLPGAKHLTLDIRSVTEADLEGVDVIFHLAAIGSVPRSWMFPKETLSVNVEGTVNLLLEAKKALVKRFIFASSSSVYAEARERSPYSISKSTAELVAALYGSDLEIIGLRYFNVFGPRQRLNGDFTAVIPKWIDAMMKGESVTINGSEHIARDFTFVENVVEANLRAMTASVPSPYICDIGCGMPITLELLYNMLRKHFPVGGCSIGEARENDINFSCANTNSAELMLGYEPKVNFPEGLTRTVEWYKLGRALGKI